MPEIKRRRLCIINTITQKEFKRLLENSPSNARFVVYYLSEGRRAKVMKSKKKGHSLNSRVNKLESRMDKLDPRMNRIESKLDQIGDVLIELTKSVKRIEARLDYNDLKKLPKNYKY